VLVGSTNLDRPKVGLWKSKAALNPKDQRQSDGRTVGGKSSACVRATRTAARFAAFGELIAASM